MLHSSDVALFALSIVVVLITPGPTNTLLAAAGLRQGVKRSVPLIGVELLGYVVSISTWGYLFASASHVMPWVPAVLRIASGAYIAYLAIGMWRATIALANSGQSSIGICTLFSATLLNPKGLLFASTIFPARAFASMPAYVVAMMEFTSLLIPIALAWIGFGAALGNEKLPWLNPVKVQRCASCILGVFSLSLTWAAFH